MSCTYGSLGYDQSAVFNQGQTLCLERVKAKGWVPVPRKINAEGIPYQNLKRTVTLLSQVPWHLRRRYFPHFVRNTTKIWSMDEENPDY